MTAIFNHTFYHTLLVPDHKTQRCCCFSLLSNQVFGVWTKSPRHESSHLCVPLAAAVMQSLIMTLMLLVIAKNI